MASVGVASGEIDIKKSGTFPIVHGIRTLAIERGIKETPTARRIDALAAEGILGSETSRDLKGALSYFMEIRLRSQLRAMKTGQREKEAIVRLGELSTPRPRPPARRAARGEALPRADPQPLQPRPVLMFRWFAAHARSHRACATGSTASCSSEDDSGEAVSLDCETTGFDPWVDDIVSIAAIRISGGRILASSAFRAVVRPEAAMRASAVKVHQLRAQDVAEGRPIGEVLPELLRFIGSRPLVGYWIAFDVSMLDKYLIEMLNIHLPNPQIDVSELYYERKYGNAPPGTTHRPALPVDPGRSRPAGAAAARCDERRARRRRNVCDAPRHAGARRAHPAGALGDEFQRVRAGVEAVKPPGGGTAPDRRCRRRAPRPRSCRCTSSLPASNAARPTAPPGSTTSLSSRNAKATALRDLLVARRQPLPTSARLISNVMRPGLGDISASQIEPSSALLISRLPLRNERA